MAQPVALAPVERLMFGQFVLRAFKRFDALARAFATDDMRQTFGISEALVAPFLSGAEDAIQRAARFAQITQIQNMHGKQQHG